MYTTANKNQYSLKIDHAREILEGQIDKISFIINELQKF